MQSSSIVFFFFVFFQIQWTRLKTLQMCLWEGGYCIYNVATASGHLDGAVFPDRKKPAFGSPVPEGQGGQTILVRGVLLCRQLFPLLQDAGAERKITAWPVSPEGPGCKAALVSCPHRAGNSPGDLCPYPKSRQNQLLRGQTFWRSDCSWGLSSRSRHPIITVSGNIDVMYLWIGIFRI